MGFLRRLLGGPSEHVETVDAWLLEPSRPDAVVEVVGEGSYQDAINRVAGPKTPDGPTDRDHVAVLVPEPGNRYDENAIAIHLSGRTAGYLSRDDAVRFGPVVKWARSHGRFIACNAAVTGGWSGARGLGEGSYGVILHLGAPGECFLDGLEAMGQPVVVRGDHAWVGWMVAFTGDSLCALGEFPIDRELSVALATKSGMIVHPRVTKKVQLLVDCDPSGASGNQLKAHEYGIPVVSEVEFWAALGLAVTRRDWRRR